EAPQNPGRPKDKNPAPTQVKPTRPPRLPRNPPPARGNLWRRETPATPGEGPGAKRHTPPQAPPASKCWRSEAEPHRRAGEAEAGPAPEMGGPALLRPPPEPRQVPLVPPRRRSHRRFRAPGRRLGLDRDQHDRAELLQRHLRVGQVALGTSEADASAPEERGRVARLREQAPAEGEARRGRLVANDLHAPPAQGRGRAAAARRPLPPACFPLAADLQPAAAAQPGGRPGLDACPQGRHVPEQGDQLAHEPALERSLVRDERPGKQRLPAVRDKLDPT